MYKASIKRHPRVANYLNSTFSKETAKFRPNSYFVRGGLDLSGEELSLDAQVSYDTEEELSKGTIAASAISNPRISFFEIVDAIGAEKAEEEIAKAATHTQDEGEK